MSKIIDITDKLNFEEKPKLIIKGEEITVNDNAAGILRIIPMLDDITPGKVGKICSILFSDEDIEKIERLDLSFKDFSTVIQQAIAAVTGGDDEGEAETPATT